MRPSGILNLIINNLTFTEVRLVSDNEVIFISEITVNEL